MLTRRENELLTQCGPGTPMGELMRCYWLPAVLSDELPNQDDPPVRVRLLGEDLVAFRDTDGRVGLLDEYCAHRRASLYFGRRPRLQQGSGWDSSSTATVSPSRSRFGT